MSDVLESARLRIRPQRIEDAEALFAAYGDTDPDNAASNGLLASLGFRREGLLRAEWETHIGVRDTLLWGLLAEDWTRR